MKNFIGVSSFWRYPLTPFPIITQSRKDSTPTVTLKLYLKQFNNAIIRPLQEVKSYGLMGSGMLENRERWETPKRSCLEVNSYSNHYLDYPSRELKIESEG